MVFGLKNRVKDSFAVAKAKYSFDKKMLEPEIVDVDAIDLSKKSIVVLCGNNTRDHMRATFYASCCYTWLGKDSRREEIPVYSIYYPKDQPLFNNYLTNDSFDYEEFARVMFEPLIAKNGKKQSAEEIATALGNVTFFGHSIGGHVMNELMVGLGGLLKKHGYSEEDINKIYESVAFIGYSPYILTDAPIKAVYVAPIYDSMGSTQKAFKKMIKSKKVESTFGGFDVLARRKVVDEEYSEFQRSYRSMIDGEDMVYYLDGNSLIVTPNLMFFDGIKEDHNLAGVLVYRKDNQFKTMAGQKTTRFMHDAITAFVEGERDKLSMKDLYERAVQTMHSENEQEG